VSFPFSPHWLLATFPKLRSRFAHAFQTDFFTDIEVALPVGGNLWAPLPFHDAYDSFSEIFILKEYHDFLPANKTFDKILDFGAHFGYFSLWMQTRQPERPLKALLVEPDERSQMAIDDLVQRNGLSNRFQYISAAVGPKEKETIAFHSRPFMASSAFEGKEDEDLPTRKRILREDEILDRCSPPFDLVKVDIEGSEWSLLRDYEGILRNTRRLLLEWHSWHNGGGGLPQIKERLSELGFRIEKESTPQPATGRGGEVGLLAAITENETV
jgi:FkbM family methyltransferase